MANAIKDALRTCGFCRYWLPTVGVRNWGICTLITGVGGWSRTGAAELSPPAPGVALAVRPEFGCNRWAEIGPVPRDAKDGLGFETEPAKVARVEGQMAEWRAQQRGREDGS